MHPVAQLAICNKRPVYEVIAPIGWFLLPADGLQRGADAPPSGGLRSWMREAPACLSRGGGGDQLQMECCSRKQQ